MLLALVLALVAASPAPAPNLVLSAGWSRATPPGATVAAGYLTITSGAQGDTLLRVSTPVASRAELHSMSMSKGTMTMRALPDGHPIAPNTVFKLVPGGIHLMFLDLPKPLVAGDKIPVTLTFAKAGAIETTLEVMPVGSRGPAP